MTDINGTPVLPLARELDGLIEQIEAEERQTHHHVAELQASGLDIDHIHHQYLGSLNSMACHAQMRQMHGAMLKVHRKIQQRHQMAIHQCRLLLSRFGSGSYTDEEMAEAINRMRALHRRMRSENALVEEERKKILAEHQAFVASLIPAREC